MHRFTFTCCLLLALRACAQPELAPPPRPPEVKFGVWPAQLRINVTPELDIVDPRFPESQVKARELLAKIDLDVLRELARKVHQIGLEATGAEAWHAMLRARTQEQVLDRIIMERTTAFDLPEYLRVWTEVQMPPEELERYDRNPLPLPARVIDERLDRCFPNYAFYIARYPIYPAKPDIVPPLAANNLFAVKYQIFQMPEGVWDGPIPAPEVTLITSPDELKTFFLTTVQPVTLLEAFAQDVDDEGQHVARAGAAAMRDDVAALLALAGELYQDGYYRFGFRLLEAGGELLTEGPQRYFADGTLRTLPTCGNGGELNVHLRYADEPLRLQSVEVKVDLQPGVRPRDQAQKLLDFNPAARKQAEDDLRLMGPEAFDYLMRERAAAGPELWANIDKLWIEIGKVPPAVENFRCLLKNSCSPPRSDRITPCFATRRIFLMLRDCP